MESGACPHKAAGSPNGPERRDLFFTPEPRAARIPEAHRTPGAFASAQERILRQLRGRREVLGVDKIQIAQKSSPTLEQKALTHQSRAARSAHQGFNARALSSLYDGPAHRAVGLLKPGNIAPPACKILARHRSVHLQLQSLDSPQRPAVAAQEFTPILAPGFIKRTHPGVIPGTFREQSILRAQPGTLPSQRQSRSRQAPPPTIRSTGSHRSTKAHCA
jgi:hypothetical protein